MPKNIITFVFLLIYIFSNAQVIEKVTIKAGENIAAALYNNGMYQFPSFAKGMIALKNGESGTAIMNFNTMLWQIQFIDPRKGDTLVISNPENVDSIILNNNIFYYDKGYIQVISNYDSVKLIFHQKVSYHLVKKGALDIPAPTVISIENYGAFPDKINYKLVLNEDIILIKRTFYYLKYKKSKQVQASQSNFLKLFPAKKKNIESYIKSENISFDKDSDLKKLLLFCVQGSD